MGSYHPVKAMKTFLILLVGVVVVCSGRDPPVNQCFAPCSVLEYNWRKPSCCKSGFVATDPCGCFPKCASPASGACWLMNSCAKGLQCLRIFHAPFGAKEYGINIQHVTFLVYFL